MKRLATIVPLIALSFALACHGAARRGPTGPYIVAAQPLPEWEESFHVPNSQWQGADANYSVALSPEKTLWLFGDTWVTKPGAGTRSGARMPRNTLAIQEIKRLGSRPRPGVPDFHWRIDKDRQALDAFKGPTPETWHWPLSGFRDGDRLFLFMTEIVGSTEGLGFAGAGNWMFAIDNMDDHPNLWRPVKSKIPFYTHSKTGDRTFGLASVVDGADVYIYGARENWLKGMGGRELIVARAPTEALSRGDFAQWRFWDGKAWDPSPDRAAALFAGAASEMSVSWLPGHKSYAAVYTDCGLSPRILARLAPSPEGPFGPPIDLYEVPDVKWSGNYFSYAAKAHPELAASDDELVITYAVNSKELGDHVNDPRIYWPRFVSVKLAKNSGAGGMGAKP